MTITSSVLIVGVVVGMLVAVVLAYVRQIINVNMWKRIAEECEKQAAEFDGDEALRMLNSFLPHKDTPGQSVMMTQDHFNVIVRILESHKLRVIRIIDIKKEEEEPFVITSEE